MSSEHLVGKQNSPNHGWMMLRFILPVLFLACCFGCRDEGAISFAKVSGTIMFCGEPLANAKVMFVPVAATAGNGLTNPISFGETDEHGQYSLSMPGGVTGAVVGSHRVMVSKIESEFPETNSDPEKDGDKPNPPQLLQKIDVVEPDPELLSAYLLANPYQQMSTRLRGEQIPTTFNTETELRFEVKKSGTNQADFEVGIDR